MTQEIRLGLVDALSHTKPPVLQWKGGEWRCWTAYNPALTAGTYIALRADGTMQQVTILPDGGLVVVAI